MQGTLRLAILALGLAFVAAPPSAIAESSFAAGAAKCSLHLDGRKVTFDLSAPGELERLADAIDRELVREKSAARPATDRGSKQNVRGLREVGRLARAAMASTNPAEKTRTTRLLLETICAINNSRLPVVTPKVDFFNAMPMFLRQLFRPVGRGNEPATDLLPSSTSDLSRSDPEPSIFWHRPASIREQDLWYGFGRTEFPDVTNKLWTYSGPKLSTGLNPGFEVKSAGVTLKLKFGEVSTEPFAARIFSALGYHADPTDYAPGVRVRYNRRLLTEFNRRASAATRFTFLGFLPVYTFELQRYHNPFNYLSVVVLCDGTRWTGRQCKAHLFREPSRHHPESDPQNFRPEIEAKIDYVVTAPANVQTKHEGGKSIGPWDFGELDHPHRREVRALGLLGAWLGWFDTRACNTRLRVVTEHGQRRLVAFCSDLGGVLGKTDGILFSRGELPNEFPWSFTGLPLDQGPRRLARPLRIEGYRPVVPNPAFAAMTIDDARWMARLIAQLNEQQLITALIASGYDSAHVRLYAEKLLSRRDLMVQDLGLSGEIALCRPDGVDRHFSYDPAVDGPIEVQVSASDPVQARMGSSCVVDGRITQHE
jgi:hypothetical protein